MQNRGTKSLLPTKKTAVLAVACMLAFFHIAKSQDLPNLNLFEAHTHCTDTLPYRIYCSELAKTPKMDTYASIHGLPLVMFLHGAGERGNNNADQLRLGVHFFLNDSITNRYPNTATGFHTLQLATDAHLRANTHAICGNTCGCHCHTRHTSFKIRQDRTGLHTHTVHCKSRRICTAHTKHNTDTELRRAAVHLLPILTNPHIRKRLTNGFHKWVQTQSRANMLEHFQHSTAGYTTQEYEPSLKKTHTINRKNTLS